MFYHGINWEYVTQQYPVLSARRTVSDKNPAQRDDRKHLLERIGMEPVHLLEERETFAKEKCIEECLRYGDTVFAFEKLPGPMWQLSPQEVAVPVLDLRLARIVYVTNGRAEVSRLFPGASVFFIRQVPGNMGLSIWQTNPYNESKQEESDATEKECE
jgi:hypothetical protein